MRAFALLSVFLLVAGCTLPFGPDGPGSVGSAAKELLDPRVREKLVVEVDHASGYGMHPDAKSALRSTLADVSGRAASTIEIIEEAEIPADAGKKYTLREIAALEEAHRDRAGARDTAVLYVLYLPGGYEKDEDDSRVLGIAYRGTSIAIMKGNIKDGTREGPLGTVPEERYVERAVLVHELGHALGLVNLGTPMQRPHEDTQNGEQGRGHSSNPKSVMYWEVETSDILANVINGGRDIPYQFDADDKADLAALRNA